MLLAFGAALTGSGEHRTLTNIATAQKTVTQQIVAELQNANPPLYVACATGTTYQAVTFTNLPTGYTAKISGVSLWDPTDSAFDYTPSQCTSNLLSSNNQSAPQLISATVSYPSGGSSVVTTVVNNPTPPTPPPAGAANNLYFYSARRRPGCTEPHAAADRRDSELRRHTGHQRPVHRRPDSDECQRDRTGHRRHPLGMRRQRERRVCDVQRVQRGQARHLQASGDRLRAPQRLCAAEHPVHHHDGPCQQDLFTQTPSNATGGTAFTTQPVVSVEDAGGNLVTSDASSVSLAVTTRTRKPDAATSNPVAVRAAGTPPLPVAPSIRKEPTR